MFSSSFNSSLGSFNSSFASHATTATTLSHDQNLDELAGGVVSPQNVAATSARTLFCQPHSESRRRSWVSSGAACASSGSLTGKRQRSPGGMMVDDDTSHVASASTWGPFRFNPSAVVFPPPSSTETSGDECSSEASGAVPGNPTTLDGVEAGMVPLLGLPPGGGRKLRNHKTRSL